MRARIKRASSIDGKVSTPGDKSVSHRALIFAALSEGTCKVTRLAPGEDVRSTARCLGALGMDVRIDADTATVVGRGLASLRDPKATLDCGNSGTTMRLFAGLIAGSGVGGILDGDAS